MPKIAKALSAKAVEALKADGQHPVGGVPGLQLQIVGNSRSWIMRTMVDGARRSIGLGAFPAVSLAQAREAAQELRKEVAQGVDPIAARQARQQAAKAAAVPAGVLTFAQASEQYIDSHRAGWRNEKHAAQWTATLDTYCANFNAKPVRDVDTADVLAALQPIWRTKTETATRVRGRVEAVLAWSVVAGHRQPGMNPAQWRGHMQLMLPAARKVTKVEHHAALPHRELPGFWRRLVEQPGVSAQALQFAVLTAARSGEVRGAAWSEVDLDAALWTVPAERMKAGREHRVPLSPGVVELLRALPRKPKQTLIFPGAVKGKPLSDMSLLAVLKRMEVAVTVHGFRSTFRDWASDCTDAPREVAEQALAHHTGDATEAAYRRTDLLDRRRALMQQWADFVTQP